jgi:glutamyl/glutaminyl-tRNA synthetase
MNSDQKNTEKKIENTSKVIVRYPPSPTGIAHIGNIRSFLFSHLVKERENQDGRVGEAVLRFEDTDRERSKKEYEEYILESLGDLGITHERGPFRQSDRTEFYVDAIETLLRNEQAFEGEESEDGSGDRVIRFKNPNKKITFTDRIRGEITIDTTEFGDFVIARSKKNPLYHLTVVVDDIDMAVTDVIRGEDHITSTPRQILLIEALGGIIPRYAHLPLIIGEDKKKLGKRHGAVTWQEFKQMGYLPEGVVNYLALLGWHPKGGSEQEIFSMQELTENFRIEDVSKSPAKFDYKKLDDINRA